MKKKASRARELLEQVVSPEQWYASPDSDRWLLTPQSDGSLLFETLGPFGFVSCRIHDPEKVVAALSKTVRRTHEATAKNLDMDAGSSSEFTAAAEQSAVRFFAFMIGDRLLETVEEAVDEAVTHSGFISDKLRVAHHNRAGLHVGLTESPAATINRFADKVAKRRRARLAKTSGMLPDVGKGSNLVRQAQYLIEQNAGGARLTYDRLAAKLTRLYGYNPPVDAQNLKKLLNRHGVKLRGQKRDK